MADDFDFDDFGDDDFLDDDTDSDDFQFDDVQDEVGDDFDDLEGFGGEMEDDFLEGDEEEVGERTGPSRTFIFAVVAMIAVFVVGLGLIVALILNPPDTGPSPRDLSATAIVATNNAIEVALAQTDDAHTAVAEAFAAATETALAATDTPTPTNTPTPTLETEEPTEETSEPTISVAPGEDTPTMEADTPTPGVIDSEAVAGTATALALILQPVGTSTLAPGVTPGIGGATVTARATSLMDSGIFDNATGGISLGVFFLMAFGLVGVIAVSRRTRTTNKRK